MCIRDSSKISCPLAGISYHMHRVPFSLTKVSHPYYPLGIPGPLSRVSCPTSPTTFCPIVPCPLSLTLSLIPCPLYPLYITLSITPCPLSPLPGCWAGQLSAASYNFASAATRGLLPKSKEDSTQKKLDAVWGVVQQVVEVR